MSREDTYLPFSQRNGLSPIPPQLKLGEVSPELRRLVDYAIRTEIERYQFLSRSRFLILPEWKPVATDLHVKFFGNDIASFENNADHLKEFLSGSIRNSKFGKLFDLIEFFIRHPRCSRDLKIELVEAFRDARLAYRIIDGQIVTIGTHEQAAAFEAAILNTEKTGAVAARSHLIGAGAALRNGSWADSVRESIHAVEAIARKINPAAKTLGEALKTIEKKGYIHGSLKVGFDKLYGYTNDQDGIRHALSEAEARVDEVDALFMLGACSSFVSYLIAREAIHGTNDQR